MLEVWYGSGLSSGMASFRWPDLWPITDIISFMSSGEASSCPPSTTPIWARPPRSLSLMSWANKTAWNRGQESSFHSYLNSLQPTKCHFFYSTFSFSCRLLWGPFHWIMAFPISSKNISPRLKLLQDTSTCRRHTWSNSCFPCCIKEILVLSI